MSFTEYVPVKKEERILRYQEDDHFCVTLRAHFDYELSDMWTTVTIQNLKNGEKKRYIFNASELYRAQSCFIDHLKLLF